MVAVIDLDEHPGARLEQRRPVDWRLLRLLGLGAIALLVTSLAGGSTWPLTRGPHTLWTVAVGDSGDPLLIDENAVYLKNHDQLTAYDLTSGAVRWRADVGGMAAAVLSGRPGQLLVMGDFDEGAHSADSDGGDSIQLFSHSTYALDRATGKQEWKAEGGLSTVSPDAALLSVRDDAGGLIGLKSVRLTDGSAVWSAPLARKSVWTTVRDQAVAVTADGAVTVRRSADGSVQSTGRIDDSQDADLYGIGNRLVADREEQVSRIYQLNPFAELWHATGQITDCGPVDCVVDDTGLTARDPDTGAALWKRAGVLEAQSTGDGGVLIDTGGGSSYGWRMGPYTLVDARTGKKLTKPIAGFLPEAGDLDGSALVLHDTDKPALSSSVTRIDARAGHAVEIGTVDRPVANTCSARGDYLACETGTQLTVTALN